MATLNKRNMEKYLEQLADSDSYDAVPCREGVEEFRALMKENKRAKRALREVFKRAQEREKESCYSFNIGWLYEQMTGKSVSDSSDVSFTEFKKAFQKLNLK